VDKVKEFWDKMSKKQKIIVVLVVLGGLGVGIDQIIPLASFFGA